MKALRNKERPYQRGARQDRRRDDAIYGMGALCRRTTRVTNDLALTSLTVDRDPLHTICRCCHVLACCPNSAALPTRVLPRFEPTSSSSSSDPTLKTISRCSLPLQMALGGVPRPPPNARSRTSSAGPRRRRGLWTLARQSIWRLLASAPESTESGHPRQRESHQEPIERTERGPRRARKVR